MANRCVIMVGLVVKGMRFGIGILVVVIIFIIVVLVDGTGG